LPRILNDCCMCIDRPVSCLRMQYLLVPVSSFETGPSSTPGPSDVVCMHAIPGRLTPQRSRPNFVAQDLVGFDLEGRNRGRTKCQFSAQRHGSANTLPSRDSFSMPTCSLQDGECKAVPFFVRGVTGKYSYLLPISGAGRRVRRSRKPPEARSYLQHD
jgi:hypothetical protein